MKRTTIKDIATYLSVSVSTVSRALSGDKNIRTETREKIFEAARELGYHRNVIAAGLRRGRSNSVAFVGDIVVSRILVDAYMEILKILSEHNMWLVPYTIDLDPEQESRLFESLESSVFDGIFVSLSASSDNNELIRRIIEKKIPVVFIANSPSEGDWDSVEINTYDKAFYLIDYLVSSGRRRVVVVTGPQTIQANVNILRAYRDVLNKFDLPFDKSLLINGKINYDDGLDIADRLLDNEVDFDAVLTFDDMTAAGVMNRLRDRGVRIPEDVAVASFFGSVLSTMLYPPLTTIEYPYAEMGRRAAHLLLKKIDNPGLSPETISLDSKIKLRESTHLDRKKFHKYKTYSYADTERSREKEVKAGSAESKKQ